MDASRIGVIFDFDGTLIDSTSAWIEVDAELLRRAGAGREAIDSAELAALTVAESGELFHRRLGLGASGAEVVAMIDELMLDFYRSRAKPRPGACALVEALARRGARMSVASSSPQAYLRPTLERCGLTPYLDAVVSVDDVGASKREPDVYDRARSLMGTPLEGTWGVEDSPYALRTLRAAGYRVLGVCDSERSTSLEQLAAEADLAVGGFEELEVELLLGPGRFAQRQGSSS